MDELNLYQGAFTGRELDRCIQRVHVTPQNTAIPFVWCLSFSLTGTAGSSAMGTAQYAEPSGFSYQYAPNFDNCEVLDVQFSNQTIVNSVSVSASGVHRINYTVSFCDSGTTDIFIYLIEGAVNPNDV